MPRDLLKGTAFEGWDPFEMAASVYMGYIEGHVKRQEALKKADEMADQQIKEEEEEAERVSAFADIF